MPVDASEVFELAAVLVVAGVAATEQTQAVIKKAAQNIKADWATNAHGIDHAPRYPRSISYDVTRNKQSIEAKIGPIDSPVNQGFLGPILEFGGIHNAPRNDGGRALDAEEPRLLDELSKIPGDTIT